MFKKITITTVITGILNGGLFTPAQATTIPKADGNFNNLSIGFGPSLSADFNLDLETTLGFSLASPVYFDVGDFGITRYDVRVNHQLYRYRSFTLSGIVGLWGDANLINSKAVSPLGLEAGVGLAYSFTPELTARLNIVPGFAFFKRSGVLRDFIPPANGFELGYKFNPNLEGTIGFNGNGDILGLRIRI